MEFDNNRHKYKVARLWLAGQDTEAAGGYWPFALLNKKADLLQTLGDWENAEMVYQSNVAWLENAGQLGYLTETQNRLAQLLTNMGNYEAAFELFRKSGEDPNREP